ncbi:MAG TPA: VOC family protein [Jatrophihabitans sp.]|jgi:hypothetical protein
MRLDHLSYAASPDGLASTIQWMGRKLGTGFTDGGIHPRFGTRNFVAPLANGSYIEVVEALDHPAAETAAFGRAVKSRTEDGGGWLAWVVAVDEIAKVEARLGRAAHDGHRVRPDGFDLRWKQIGLTEFSYDPQLPYFIEWEGDAAHHPSAGGSSVTLTDLEIAGDEKTVDDYLDSRSAQPLDGITVEWSAPGEDGSGLVAVTFSTPNGAVRIY